MLSNKLSEKHFYGGNLAEAKTTLKNMKVFLNSCKRVKTRLNKVSKRNENYYKNSFGNFQRQHSFREIYGFIT